ncbi:hypothetical protein AOLI_G00198610 [Acnodon oligacanthus]
MKNRNVPLTWTNQTSTQSSASKTLTIVTHPAPVSEMERSGAVLIALACVLFSRISGAEVEMRVRPGDNVVLYSDCVLETGLVVWFRNSSNESQSPLIISGDTLMLAAFSHYSFVWNSSSKTRDLLVKNVNESDLGLYYCAQKQTKFIKDGTGADVGTVVYHYGNRTTRLSFLDSTAPCVDLQTPSTPPVSDCSVCWKLLVSVCPVCVLLSSTCLYCIYRHTTKVEKEAKKKSERAERQKCRSDEVGEDGVCYASLDHKSRRQKRPKKKRFESSDFSTYSEVLPPFLLLYVPPVLAMHLHGLSFLYGFVLHVLGKALAPPSHEHMHAGLLYPPTGHSMHNSAPYLSRCKRTSYNSQHEVPCPLAPTAIEAVVLFMAALHYLQATPPTTNNVSMTNGTPHVTGLHSSRACKHGHPSSSAFTTLLSHGSPGMTHNMSAALERSTPTQQFFLRSSTNSPKHGGYYGHSTKVYQQNKP